MCRTLTTGASGPFTVSACGQPGRRPEAPSVVEGYRDPGEGPERGAEGPGTGPAGAGGGPRGPLGRSRGPHVGAGGPS